MSKFKSEFIKRIGTGALYVFLIAVAYLGWMLLYGIYAVIDFNPVVNAFLILIGFVWTFYIAGYTIEVLIKRITR